jgi:hypothetical protein
MTKKPKNTLPYALSAVTGLTASVSATLVVHEPFDYADTGPSDGVAYLGDGNQSGGLGLGPWRQANSRSDNTNEIEVSVPGLGFTDTNGNVLPASGGYAVRTSRVGQNSISSNLTVSASSALTADNSTMWMSFLYVDNGFSGPDSAIALASQDMVAADSQNLVSSGYGVGVAFEPTADATRSIATAYFNGSTSSTKVLEATPTFQVSGGPEGQSFLLAAKVNWNPDGVPDEIFVFNISDLTTEPAESEALASDTFDMSLANQQSLNILTIGETQVDGFDEIRLGTTFASVAPIPEPGSLALAALGGLMMFRRRR